MYYYDKYDKDPFYLLIDDLKSYFKLTVCSRHVTYAFQSESTLYICLNVQELLVRSRREI